MQRASTAAGHVSKLGEDYLICSLQDFDQRISVFPVLGGEKRVGYPGGAATSSASNAMDVVVDPAREVVVHHHSANGKATSAVGS